MQVEAMLIDRDAALLPNGMAEVHVQVLYNEGDLDPVELRQCRRLPKGAADLLPEWAQRLTGEWSIRFIPDYHLINDSDEEPEHDYDHEDWYVFRAMDLEG